MRLRPEYSFAYFTDLSLFHNSQATTMDESPPYSYHTSYRACRANGFYYRTDPFYKPIAPAGGNSMKSSSHDGTTVPTVPAAQPWGVPYG